MCFNPLILHYLLSSSPPAAGRLRQTFTALGWSYYDQRLIELTGGSALFIVSFFYCFLFLFGGLAFLAELTCDYWVHYLPVAEHISIHIILPFSELSELSKAL